MAQENIIVSCENCGTKNRISSARVNDNPVCGKCRHPSTVGKIYSRPLDISDKSFENEVLRHPGLVLMDCWAQWCGPCRMIGPVLEEIASENAGRLKVVKLNVDENPTTASKFSVRSIPTILVFVKGKLMDTMVGALPKSQIISRLRQYM